ncbi:MAG: site-specific integrase, partial [Gammaproteobacteria bacterium]|nr:site-specific integrase [Gammaproteobacteria bacterium]
MSDQKISDANLDVIDSFLDQVFAEDGLSRATLEAYRLDLKKLAAWVG